MRSKPSAERLNGSAVGDEMWHEPLSPQELSCLLGLWDGLTMKGIAARMGLSPITVKNYLHNLYGKLGVTGGQVAAVRKALELGILRLPARARPKEWDVEVPGEVLR